MVLISLSAREDALRVSVPAWVQAVAAQGAEACSAAAVELAPADAAVPPGDAAARPGVDTAVGRARAVARPGADTAVGRASAVVRPGADIAVGRASAVVRPGADTAAGPGDAAARPVGAAAALAAQAGAAEARASLTARLGAGSRFATEVEVGSEPRSCCLPLPAPPRRQRMLRAVASPQSAGGPDSGWRAAPGWCAPSGRAGVAPV